MIDSQLQQQLRERFNPEGSQLRNMQIEMLSILKVIDDICKRNNIPYWIASGTLIGAMRHGGFIPWDDDLDIEILYKDKKRFIKACEKDLPERYKLQSHKTDKSYCMNILKVRDMHSHVHEMRRWGGKEYPIEYDKYNGYFVDVFTIEKSSRPLLWCSRVPIRLLSIAQFRWGWSSRNLSLLYVISEMFYSVLRCISKLNPFAKYYYHSYGSWFMSRRIKDEVVPTSLISFEGEIVSAPNNSDAFLRRIYGDYMRLPESSQQHPTHDTTL